MINVLLSRIDHEKVSIYRFEEIVTDKGGSKKIASLIKEGLVVSIQASSSLHSVGGQQIIADIAGKKNKAVYLVYSPNFKIKDKDLILRDDGLIYEVQHIEKNGRGTILEHDRYYIVKYDNQNILKEIK